MRAASQIILLVEDDHGQADLIRLNLEIGNVLQKIVHVTDGEQALDFLRRQGRFHNRPPCAVLVLLDLNLPRLDGLEFIREVKSCQPLRQTPIVVFAAGDNPLVISECYDLGCSLYFPKPPLFEEFIGTVERLAGLIQSVSIPAAS